MRSRSLDATLRPGPSTLVAGAAIAVSIVLAPVLPDPVLAQSTTGDTRSAPAAKASPSRGATAAQAAEALPAWLSEFERGNVTDFEPRAPGLGAGLRYSLPRRGARADVFLYDRNSPVPISEDAASGPVRDEFARTMREVEGFYRSRKILQLRGAAQDDPQPGSLRTRWIGRWREDDQGNLRVTFSDAAGLLSIGLETDGSAVNKSVNEDTQRGGAYQP